MNILQARSHLLGLRWHFWVQGFRPLGVNAADFMLQSNSAAVLGSRKRAVGADGSPSHPHPLQQDNWILKSWYLPYSPHSNRFLDWLSFCCGTSSVNESMGASDCHRKYFDHWSCSSNWTGIFKCRCSSPSGRLMRLDGFGVLLECWPCLVTFCQATTILLKWHFNYYVDIEIGVPYEICTWDFRESRKFVLLHCSSIWKSLELV